MADGQRSKASIGHRTLDVCGRPPASACLFHGGEHFGCVADDLDLVVFRKEVERVDHRQQIVRRLADVDLARVVAVGVALVAFSLALVATVQEQAVFALGLITLATTAGFVASWSTSTVRRVVGSHVAGPSPRHRLADRTLTRAQSRSFDYLLMR